MTPSLPTKLEAPQLRPAVGQRLGCVMVVDDEELIVELLSEILQAEGFDVIPTIHPELALEAVRQHKPDVVFTDLTMPKVSGVELLHQIRGLSKNIKIYFVTGNLTKEAKLETLQGEVAGVLEKPFNVDEVISICKSVCKASHDE